MENPVTPEPLTKKYLHFRSGFLLANWKKYPTSFTDKEFFSFGNGGQVRFDRSKLNAIAKAKKLCAIDSRISFLA